MIVLQESCEDCNHRGFYGVPYKYILLAHLDRALGFEPRGSGFKSYMGYHTK